MSKYRLNGLKPKHKSQELPEEPWGKPQPRSKLLPPQPRVIAKLKDGREFSFHFKTQKQALEFIDALDCCMDVETREMQIGRMLSAPAWYSGPAKLICDNNPVTSTKH